MEFNFDFEKLAEETSPEFVNHIKSELMGVEYKSSIVKYEVERDSEKIFTIRFLESWKSVDYPDHIGLKVLVFNFYKLRNRFNTDFNEVVSTMREYLRWVDEVSK
ncbi:hypothetical protein [Paenibacillus elgii]|uniref:hypothetical protein n=1 Tax=Paenibacillus elgii TaxID=189691 RepID=UPI0013D4E2B4|nr:hypothetical protein [Paenibacillus elgii]